VARRLGDEAADYEQAVAAGRERDTRLVFAHLALESFEIGLSDVGRIGDDDVEARTLRFVVFAPGVEAVRLAELEAVAHAVALGVARRDAQRRRRDVGTDAARVAALAQQRDRDAARPRADVAEARRLRPLQQFERRLDQKLRLGARDEHVGRDLEIQPVELLPARDVLQGFARGPARGEPADTSGRFLGQTFVVVREEVRAVAPERVSE
jgi:hypothetical protein